MADSVMDRMAGIARPNLRAATLRMSRRLAATANRTCLVVLAGAVFLVALPALAQAPPPRTLPVGDPTLAEQVHFYHPDPLGSTRAISDDQGVIVARYDYLPFGEQIPADVSSRDEISGYAENADQPLNTRKKFTGKERDAESSLDYFQARYFSAAAGRFISPDEFTAGELGSRKAKRRELAPLPYADLTDPQSLNKYAYVLNNPLRHVDPRGHCVEDACIVEGLLAAGVVVAESPEGQALAAEAEQALVPIAAEAEGALAQAAEAGSQFAGQALAKSGQALEKAAQQFEGVAKNTERILEGGANGARFRIPDLLSTAGKFLGEVKDRASVSLTKQMGDFFGFAKTNGLDVRLYVREGARLSQRLATQIQESGGKVYAYVDKEWIDVTQQYTSKH